MNKEQLIEKWGTPQKVLDHGMVRLVDLMGDDAAIVQMARTSYGEGTQTVNDDRKLLRLLMRHKHTSPFEGCVIKLHVKLPILVARQWIRHRTASLNEVSARYSVLPDEFYVPDLERISYQSLSNKQGSAESFELPKAKVTADAIDAFCKDAYSLYEKLISEGLSRELARMVLPVNIYTEFYWVQNLHNMLHFIRLRLHPHAQYEIRVFADVIAKILKDWVPHTFEAYEEYVLNSVTLTQKELNILLELIGSKISIFQNKSLRKELFDKHEIETIRERIEFMNKIGVGPNAL